MASPCAGAPALKYGYVNTVTPSPDEAKGISNYKISIIYTFNNYSNSIELFNNYEGFKLSSINTEEKLKKSIDDIKIKNSKKHNNDFIIIYLDNCDSDKMKFTANFINKYYKEDEYHYILILFINPLAPPGEAVTVFTYPYLSAGATAQGKAKRLLSFLNTIL